MLIDPKGRGLAPLGGLPHVWRLGQAPGAGVVQEVAAAAAALAALVAEMERRDAAGRSLPRLVVAVDELADLLQTGGKAVAEALTRLTQRGREAGIHVVAATQRPAAALVGGLMKANFPVRLVGSVVSAEDAQGGGGDAGDGGGAAAGAGGLPAGGEGAGDPLPGGVCGGAGAGGDRGGHPGRGAAPAGLAGGACRGAWRRTAAARGQRGGGMKKWRSCRCCWRSG